MKTMMVVGRPFLSDPTEIKGNNGETQRRRKFIDFQTVFVDLEHVFTKEASGLLLAPKRN